MEIMKVSIDAKEFEKWTRQLGELGVQKAAVQAINRTARNVATTAAKWVREKYAVPAKKIKAGITIIPALRDSEAPVAEVRIRQRRFPAHWYRVRVMKNRGIKVKVNRTRQVHLPHAFEVRGRWWQRERAGKGKLVPRYPIRMIFIGSTWAALGARRSQIIEFIAEKLNAHFVSRAKYMHEKLLMKK